MSNINITSGAPELKLEVGKRYVTRGGIILPPLKNSSSFTYPFESGGLSWARKGSFVEGVPNHIRDIVSEYHEPSPAQWTLCKDRMPTEADGFQGSGDPDDNGNVAWWTGSFRGILWFPWNTPPHDGVAWFAFPPYIAPAEPADRVFLDMEDVPPGSVIRRKDSKHGWIHIAGVDCDGIFLMTSDGPQVQHNWNELGDYEISTDGGKTWGDCSKVRILEEEA